MSEMNTIDSPEELREALRNLEGSTEKLQAEILLGIYAALQRIAEALEKRNG